VTRKQRGATVFWNGGLKGGGQDRTLHEPGFLDKIARIF